MAITTEYLNGFETGLISTSGPGITTGLQHCTAFTNATIVSASPRSGAYSLRITSAAANSRYRYSYVADTTRKQTLSRIAFRTISVTTGNLGFICGIGGTGSTTASFDAWVNGTTGNIEVAAPGPGTTVVGPAVNDGAWHVVEMQCDWRTGTPTLDWRVDGVAQTQAIGTGATTAATVAIAGAAANLWTGTMEYDDFIVGTWTATSDWYGNGEILSLLPGSDGTHSFTSNDFSLGDTASGQPVGSTVMWAAVADALPWTTVRTSTSGTNIAQRILRTTGYCEIKPATANAAKPTANAVQGELAYSASGGLACTLSTYTRNSAGTETQIWGTSAAAVDYSETSNFFARSIVAVPVTGWTSTEINAMRWRVGHSGDVSPVPTAQALLLEIDYPTSFPTPPVTVIPDLLMAPPSSAR